jgi:DNA polymerase-1
MKDYAISDTVFTYKLWEKFMPMLEAQELQEAYDRDLKALLAIVEIERTGLQVDIEGLRKLKEDMALEIVRKQQAVYKITGEAFNMNSAEELKSMFEKLGVVWQWYTDKGNVSDNKNVMEYLEKTFEGQPAGDMARLVLEIRKASKTLSTFIEGLIMFSDTDGRVHCDFNLCPKDDGKGGTVTGRLSSSSPNMQNVTKKDSNIRKLIAAEPGFILVEGDYSQQEYRLLAHYCKDPNLMQAIENGWDVHQATASMIEHVPYEEVTPAQRKASKAINFSLVYGTGLAAFAKAAHLKIDDTLYNQGMFYIRDKGIKPWDATLERCLSLYDGDARAQEAIRYYFSEEPAKAIAEAKKLKEEYFARFPLVQTFLEDVIATCKSRGYIRMWDGRRRHFKSPKSEAYKAPNALIQGGCGSITKEKIAECVEYLKDKKSKMVNTIHDSLVWQIHLSELDIVEDLRAILDNNNFRVPITCDIEAGWNWGEMTKIKSVDDLRRIVNGVCEKIS